MKATTLKTLIAVTFATSSVAFGAVTLQFSVPFAAGSGVANGFASQAGVPTNGLNYGIIVDGLGNGIGTTYDAVTLGVGPAIGNVGFALTSGGLGTDDRLYFAQDLTMNNGGLSEGDFVTTGGDGGISGIVFDFAGDVGAGDTYGIVWFDSDGVNAGLLTNGAFTLPANGNIVDSSAPFEGADPARPADDIQFGVIPEPSVAILGALGVLGLVRRRR